MTISGIVACLTLSIPSLVLQQPVSFKASDGWTIHAEAHGTGKREGRKLYVVAKDDANAAGPRLPRIQKQYEATNGPKELLILEGSAHAQFMFDTPQGPRLTQDILRFLEK